MSFYDFIYTIRSYTGLTIYYLLLLLLLLPTKNKTRAYIKNKEVNVFKSNTTQKTNILQN